MDAEGSRHLHLCDLHANGTTALARSLCLLLSGWGWAAGLAEGLNPTNGRVCRASESFTVNGDSSIEATVHTTV